MCIAMRGAWGRVGSTKLDVGSDQFANNLRVVGPVGDSYYAGIRHMDSPPRHRSSNRRRRYGECKARAG